MLDKIRIRSFKPEDQIDSRNLILVGLGEHFGYIDHNINTDLEDIYKSYTSEGNVFLVALIGQKIVGTGGLLLKQNNVCEIVRVSVLKEFRRKGIGSKITKKLMIKAKEKGYNRVSLETLVGWQDAIGLYESRGFKVHSRNEIDIFLYLDL